MANKFVTILDDVGNALKKFFSSPVVEAVAQGGIDIAEVAFPQFDTLLSGLSKSLATAQALAQAANPTGETTEQVTALVLADAQEIFQAYETATGSTIETSQQQAIIAAFIALLNSIPAPTTTTVSVGTTTASTTTAPTTTPTTTVAV